MLYSKEPFSHSYCDTYSYSYILQAVFYLDHNYLENMFLMFRKINSKEKIVGFYSTGPQIRPNDLRIYDVVRQYSSLTPSPTHHTVFCVIDVRPDRHELPVKAYQVVHQEQHGSSSSSHQITRTFAHLPVQMGALEAEEIGVEHLLRDINDPTISTIASLVRQRQSSVGTLHTKLRECQAYLEEAATTKNDNYNAEILDNLQRIQHLLPNLQEANLIQSLIVKTNDYYMAMYIAALVRGILALHDLINNKLRYGPDGMVDQEEKKQETKL